MKKKGLFKTQLKLFAILMVLVNLASHVQSQQIGSIFTWEGVGYYVTSLNPNTVQALGYTGTGGGFNLDIPQTVQEAGVSYTVTAFGNQAFKNKNLPSVTIPHSVTRIAIEAFRNNRFTRVSIPHSVTDIGNWAFYDNQLTSVTIPDGVTNIADFAFVANPITQVVSKNEIPPALVDFNTFQNPNNIDLFVPEGTVQTYLDAGSTGFKTILEEESSLSLGNNVFANSLRITNPVTTLLTINGPDGLELKAVTLYSLLGKQVLRTTNTTIDTSSLPSGLYILKIENTAGQIATKKIIKQ